MNPIVLTLFYYWPSRKNISSLCSCIFVSVSNMSVLHELLNQNFLFILKSLTTSFYLKVVNLCFILAKQNLCNLNLVSMFCFSIQNSVAYCLLPIGV
jgi:hypothetical protein